MRPHETRVKDMGYLIDTGVDSEYLKRYLKVFLKYPMVDHADLLSSAWDSLVVHHLISRSTRYGFVSNVVSGFKHLIELGADLHQPFGNCCSTYIQILNNTYHPFDADDSVHTWMTIMKACGVDIKSYVERETRLIEEAGIKQDRNERKREVVHTKFDGLPVPSWRWEQPAESEIIEVLEAFYILGCDHMEYELILAPSSQDDLKHWKVGNDRMGWWKTCFPFSLDPIDCINGVGDYRLDQLWCRETYNRAVDIRDKRFARRRARRWRKAHPGEKSPSNKMPGTWVD